MVSELFDGLVGGRSREGLRRRSEGRRSRRRSGGRLIN